MHWYAFNPCNHSSLQSASIFYIQLYEWQMLYVSRGYVSRLMQHACFLKLSSSESTMETVDISEETVNPGNEKIGPESFELLKVLGKGGYGKVCR